MSCAAFKIEKSIDGGLIWVQIDTVPQGTVNYQASGIADSQSTKFRVRGYIGANNSDYSNIATQACSWIPIAPSNLYLTCGV